MESAKGSGSEESFLARGRYSRQRKRALRVLHLRLKEHPVFSRRWWFQGRPIHGAGVSDIGWFTPDGAPMVEKNWGDGFEMSFAVFLNGEALTFPGPRRERIADNSFYLIFNTRGDSQLFRFPFAEFETRWEKVLDTCKFKILDQERFQRPRGRWRSLAAA